MDHSIWKLFVNIKNGHSAKCSFILHSRKKIYETFLQILWKEGFILGYNIYGKSQKKLKIFLKYKNSQSVIHNIKTISKPGRRIYYSTTDIWKINSNKLFLIFFTPKGLKSISECKKCKIGGEAFILVN